ncbi:MAG: hypothetical protein AAF320_03760 [Myxococcota bacterium]
MALLMALSMLVLLSAVVADLSYRESIRYKLAVHHRDALQARALAEGGVEFARLILVVQDKLQGYLNAASQMGMPLPAPVVWQLIPLHSDLFKQLVSGDLLMALGMDVSEALQNRQQQAAQQDDDKKKDAKAFVKPKGGFGAFQGSFAVEIVDEESKISLRPWAAQTTSTQLKKAVADKLHALFSPVRHDDLFHSQAGAVGVDRWSLVGNLYDYTQSGDRRIDPQAPAQYWGRATGGSKSNLYVSTPHVAPKKAYFDSQEELRLVHGMTDAHMETFGDAVTIYGGDQEGKVNILTASDQVVEALIRYCAKRPDDSRLRVKAVMVELLKRWQEHRMGKDKKQATPSAFVGFLQEQKVEIDPQKCADAVTDRSQVFTIRSTATVGNVTKRLTLVTRVVRNVEDRYFFSVQ